ncbi:MAG TPA: glycosyltransferase [Rhizomicrobium sp.]|jgi:spore maturation protein CgeB
MKLAIFGLTISSSWGNGHATLWRGLCRALASQGHRTVFFERDVTWYAGARDCWGIPGGELVLYREWREVAARARQAISEADAAIVTSYCPDALAAAEHIFESSTTGVFYDLDTPVTLGRIGRGEGVPYIGASGLAGFDLVLSFTGGAAIEALRERLGATRVAPLYGHVDPDLHRPVAPVEAYRGDLSYLGTYAPDRQDALEQLFVVPARARPAQRFVIGGAQYPYDFPWSANIYFLRHVSPDNHPAFFASSRLTLNITRRDMAAMGWCPSGRLFEAAACGCPLVTDSWDGLDAFFAPGDEVIVARKTGDVLAALDSSDEELRAMGSLARERVLAEHTSERRAEELIRLISEPRGVRDMRCHAHSAGP